MRRFWGLMLMLAAGVGAYFAIYSVLWQDAAIRHFVPVEAQIVRTELRRHSGKKTTYSPEVTYTYTFGNRMYTSERVLPFSQSGGASWANGILQHYQVFPTTTAYVNPQKPEEAILERTYAFFPYLLSLGALTGVAVGIGIIAGVIGGTRDQMAAVPIDAAGYFLLLPARSLRLRLRDAVSWLAAGAIVVTPLMLHWLLVAGQSSGYVFMAVEAALLLLLLTIVVRRWQAARNLSDARVRVKPVPMIRGTPFELDLEADAYRPLQVTSAQCKVVCVEHYKERRGTKTHTGTRIKRELPAELCGALQVPAGEIISGRAVVVAEADAPASSATRTSYPFYTWELRVKITLAREVDYAGVFPFEAV